MLGGSNINNEMLQIQIQRIYVKDMSFESPKSPQIFQEEWDPEIKLNLDTQSYQLAKEVYEIILRITVTVEINNEMSKNTAFLCEIQQAGIFIINGVKDSQIPHCLGAYCPNILFPYARECLSNLVSKGSFPQLNLAPVNFDALFINSLQQYNKNDQKGMSS